MDRLDDLPLERRLRQETLLARERVYHYADPTPLEPIPLDGLDLWVKREDLSPIKAYKWRGACNRMSTLSESERARGVVTASAGNHAQGVALVAHKLGVAARIYMPRSTPRVKQDAVRKHGGEWVEIILSGDSYDAAVSAAREDERQSGAVYIHAYDDLLVMAGQATLADEVVLSGKGPFDVAYVQIGGGGVAAGVAEWLSAYWPEIEIIGVEAEGQASMKKAIETGYPVDLDELDIFCDGTAVRKAGELPYQILKNRLSRIETVTNREVASAIRTLWETMRCISEPSGALGLAAALKNRAALKGKRVLTVLCGANIDFQQLGHIANTTGAGSLTQRTFQVAIPEEPGTMRRLLDQAFDGLSITDFQYGKVHTHDAFPVFTLSSEQAEPLNQLTERLDQHGFQWNELHDAVDVQFRAIPLRTDLLDHPVFLRLEFYERPGALHDFLVRQAPDHANLCYFNYRQTGERIGRALIGIDFPSETSLHQFLDQLPRHGEGYRLCQPLDAEASARLSANCNSPA
ncbi:MAG: pyridoxal-phosphate dependent enzyme [Verrucomicrobiales bacterium]